jgi:hypothetical protein
MRHAACRMVLWLLAIALPVYGCAGTLVQLLGPMHRHAEPVALHAAPGFIERTAAESLGWLVQGLGRWQAYAHEQAHAHGAFVHPHQHNAFERHYHGVDDPSVVSLDGKAARGPLAAELGAAATAGSATLPLGLAVALVIPPAAVTAHRWSDHRIAAWHNAEPRRLDRPPQTRRLAFSPRGRPAFSRH